MGWLHGKNVYSTAMGTRFIFLFEADLCGPVIPVGRPVLKEDAHAGLIRAQTVLYLYQFSYL